MKNILPVDVDLTNSREYYGAYNSKDLYKGKSFNMSGSWSVDIHYFNDGFITDFVAYKGALLSCTRSHQSSSLNEPKLIFNEQGCPIGVENTQYWTFVLGSVPGEQGKPGDVYVPTYDEKSGTISWSLSNELPEPMKVRGNGINYIVDKGVDGGVELTIVCDDGQTETFTLYHGKDGLDGKNGVDGSKLINSTQKEFDDHTDLTLVFKDGDGVVSEVTTQIPHGKDGIDGDENIWIGQVAPEDKEQIWYDPSDEYAGGWTSEEFLYESYKSLGGNLSQDAFIKAFAGVNGLSVQIIAEKVESPTQDMMNIIWMIPTNVSEDNKYEEWIVLKDEATGQYFWEKWGSGSLDVNLDNYYTKDQINQYVSEEISKSFDGGSSDDISGWE